MGSGADWKTFKRILLVCGGVVVLSFGMIPFLGPSPEDRQREESMREHEKLEKEQISQAEAQSDKMHREVEAMDRAQKKAEQENREWEAQHADGELQTTQEKADWVRRQPGGGVWTGSDADLARMYDRVKSASGN